MSPTWISAVFMRGGTSKGLFFHDGDLPGERSARDAVFLAALGSPDPYGRQLNGMGGGISSLSKVVSVKRSSRADADIDYTFAQIAVDRPVVDYSSNCGNLTAAVGPFAVDEGLLHPADGLVTVRLYNTNTDRIVHARFQVRDGLAVAVGDFATPGVSGTGAPIELMFLGPGGSRTGRLLPTGRARDDLRALGRPLEATLVDAATPLVCVRAADFEMTGAEAPHAIETRPGVMDALDAARRLGAVAMGLAEVPEEVPLAAPKLAVVAPPATYTTISGEVVHAGDFDFSVRALSMERVHLAVPGTVGLGLAVACAIEGSCAAEVVGRRAARTVRLGTPSGIVTTSAQVLRTSSGYEAVSASIFRTARRLMQGEVRVG